MGSLLLCAGAPGKRYSLPNSRIMIHQPMGGFSGQVSDVQIHAEEMIRQLIEGQEQVVRTARELLSKCEETHDAPTADLLTQRMEVHEKNAWMLRSLLEK